MSTIHDYFLPKKKPIFRILLFNEAIPKDFLRVKATVEIQKQTKKAKNCLNKIKKKNIYRVGAMPWKNKTTSTEWELAVEK